MNDKYRLVCVMPIYKRPEITRLSVECLQQQTVPFFKIVLVGSSDIDRMVAKKCNTEYVHYSNEYLSRKCQAGLIYAKKYDPYAVVFGGSDDLIYPAWNETLLRECEGYDLLGARELLMLDYTGSHTGPLYRLKYKTSQNFFGPGTSFTREYLDKVNWEAYNIVESRQCDGGAQKIAANANARTKTIRGLILSVKGDWDMIDSLDHLKAARSIVLQEISNTRSFLRRRFPLALKLLA